MNQPNFKGLVNMFNTKKLGQMNQKIPKTKKVHQFKKVYAIESYEYRIKNSKKTYKFPRAFI